MRARLGASVSGRYRPAENSLLTKHLVAAGKFAKDAGSTPAASIFRSALPRRTKNAAPKPAEGEGGQSQHLALLEIPPANRPCPMSRIDKNLGMARLDRVLRLMGFVRSRTRIETIGTVDRRRGGCRFQSEEGEEGNGTQTIC